MLKSYRSIRTWCFASWAHTKVVTLLSQRKKYNVTAENLAQTAHEVIAAFLRNTHRSQPYFPSYCRLTTEMMEVEAAESCKWNIFRRSFLPPAVVLSVAEY